MDQLERRTRNLASLASRKNPAFQKLAAAPEDKVLQFLSSSLDDVQVILRTLPAVDAYFRGELSSAQRNIVLGIKVEINAIKNSYIKANQKRHEYISRKEENDQLKKLGVDTDS